MSQVLLFALCRRCPWHLWQLWSCKQPRGGHVEEVVNLITPWMLWWMCVLRGYGSANAESILVK